LRCATARPFVATKYISASTPSFPFLKLDIARHHSGRYLHSHHSKTDYESFTYTNFRSVPAQSLTQNIITTKTPDSRRGLALWRGSGPV
jgi:hypothetical protein